MSRTISVADMVVGGVGFGLVRLFVWLLVGLIAIQAFKMGCVDGGPEMHKLRIEFVRPDSRLSWRPLSFQTKRAMSANGT